MAHRNYTSTIDTTQDMFRDAYKLVEEINKKQFEIIDCLGKDNHSHITVLFNKGRYFEMSIYDTKLRASIAQAIKCKVEFGNMICGPKSKLEALSKAFNKRNYFLKINVDWI